MNDRIKKDIEVFESVFGDSVIFVNNRDGQVYVNKRKIDYTYFSNLIGLGIVELVYYNDDDKIMIYKLVKKDLDQLIYNSYQTINFITDDRSWENISDPILHIYRDNNINEIL